MTSQPPFARGARETAEQMEADFAELRAELGAALQKRHDPHYVADRLLAASQLEMTLLRRFRDEIIPRLKRQEATQTLEQRIEELERWRQHMEQQ